MLHFGNIDYLQHGSAIQQEVFHLLHHKKILYHLRDIRPVVAGTLPLDLFIPNQSDIDILGSSKDMSSVEKLLVNEFSQYERFSLHIKPLRDESTLICRFHLDFMFEIFVQSLSVERQYGYRHLLVEQWLLTQGGRLLRDQIFALKKAGMKTEPAFAQVLGLEGDPFEALLAFENDPEFIRFANQSEKPTP